MEDMKPDILRIKKSAQDNITYYYNREKRMANRSGTVINSIGKNNQKKKGFDKKLLILNIGFLVLIVIGINYFFQKEDEVIRFKSFTVTLTANPVKDKLFITMDIKKENRGENMNPGAMALFETSPLGFSATYEFDLPQRAGQQKFTLPWKQENKLLSIVITIGDETRSIDIDFD